MLIVAVAGILGWFSCFFVGARADWFLNVHPEYSQPASERSAMIRTKYHEGYVEPSYAIMFKRSETWNVGFWILILIGGLGWSVLKDQDRNKK